MGLSWGELGKVWEGSRRKTGPGPWARNPVSPLLAWPPLAHFLPRPVAVAYIGPAVQGGQIRPARSGPRSRSAYTGLAVRGGHLRPARSSPGPSAAAAYTGPADRGGQIRPSRSGPCCCRCCCCLASTSPPTTSPATTPTTASAGSAARAKASRAYAGGRWRPSAVPPSFRRRSCKSA